MTNNIAKAHVYPNGDEAQTEVRWWNEDGVRVAELLDHADGYIVRLTLGGGTYYVGG